MEKHTRVNKLQIELEVVGQPIQTLSTDKKVCITIQTSLLNADSAVFDDALSLPVDVSIPLPLRRLESAASYQIALKYFLCA